MAIGTLATWYALQLRQQGRRDSWLVNELAHRVSVAPTNTICAGDEAVPLKLLILGQSNAGNHGPRVELGAKQATVQMRIGGDCINAQDPLPGASGDGASIWSRLPTALSLQGLARPPEIALLAIQSTTIDDWARPSSPLNQALRQELQALSKAGWTPDLVLWQQGEADVLSGTSTNAYQRSWGDLLRQMQGDGLRAPVLLAHSTHCRFEQTNGIENKLGTLAAKANNIRLAMQTLTQEHSQLLLGPDTDELAGPTLRRDGCHFSSKGLDEAARLWSQAIAFALNRSAP